MIARTCNEKGQVLLLAVGFTLVTFAVAGVAVDGARAWLLRRGLQHSADAAVLAGAAELDAAALYTSEGSTERIDSSAAIKKANSLLAGRGLGARFTVRVEGDRVHAIVRAQLDTSFLSLVGIDGLPVAAEATAAPVFGEAP